MKKISILIIAILSMACWGGEEKKTLNAKEKVRKEVEDYLKKTLYPDLIAFNKDLEKKVDADGKKIVTPRVKNLEKIVGSEKLLKAMAGKYTNNEKAAGSLLNGDIIQFESNEYKDYVNSLNGHGITDLFATSEKARNIYEKFEHEFRNKHIKDYKK